MEDNWNVQRSWHDISIPLKSDYVWSLPTLGSRSMSKALATTLILAELHSDSRTGRKVIKSLTKHDNCLNYYQYLHSTLSAFSQGTVLSQLSMLFFNEFDSFNIRTTFVKPQDYRVKQIYVAASRAKHAKIRQNVSSFKTLVGINLLPLYSPQGIFLLELWPPKKTSQWLRSFAPAYHHHHPRTDSVVPHPKSSTNGTVRAKKEMNTVVFWNTTRHSLLHPRALAQMQFQIVSNPVCINIILYLYYLYIYKYIWKNTNLYFGFAYASLTLARIHMIWLSGLEQGGTVYFSVSETRWIFW